MGVSKWLSYLFSFLKYFEFSPVIDRILRRPLRFPPLSVLILYNHLLSVQVESVNRMGWSLPWSGHHRGQQCEFLLWLSDIIGDQKSLLLLEEAAAVGETCRGTAVRAENSPSWRPPRRQQRSEFCPQPREREGLRFQKGMQPGWPSDAA